VQPYQIFFFASLSFLVGVLFKSIGLGAGIVYGTLLLAAVFLLTYFINHRRQFLWFCALTVLVPVGAVYFEAYDVAVRTQHIVFDTPEKFLATVVSNPVIRDAVQEFAVQLRPPYEGGVLIKSARYPQVAYGDVLEITGTITRPAYERYAGYLASKKISGIARFPRIEVTEDNVGLPLKTQLYEIRNRAQYTFERILAPREAAFLNGITFGGYGGFSKDFREAMSRSGTTHLVALSGYNISIIIWAAMGVFLTIFSRRASWILTVLLIIGFVVMTGAEASVVRAAIMGSLVIVARGIGRTYDMRNAVILAALLMVLVNPHVLVFDVGFQLSFLALLGIVYLKPALQKVMHAREEEGFLSWRDNLYTTTSAQLAVAPLLITQFGQFSLTALLANVAILELIPVTMAVGFVMAAVALVSITLATVIGWFVYVLVHIEVLLIQFFSMLYVPLRPSLSLGSVIMYYIFIVGILWWVNRKRI